MTDSFGVPKPREHYGNQKFNFASLKPFYKTGLNPEKAIPGKPDKGFSQVPKQEDHIRNHVKQNILYKLI